MLVACEYSLGKHVAANALADHQASIPITDRRLDVLTIIETKSAEVEWPVHARMWAAKICKDALDRPSLVYKSCVAKRTT